MKPLLLCLILMLSACAQLPQVPCYMMDDVFACNTR